MLKIIADSGSTKTDWVVIDENSNEVERIKTIGFNPYFQSTEVIFNEITLAFSRSNIDCDTVSEIHYYGAGCSSEKRKYIIENALRPAFIRATVNLNHDLIAAARATLGKSDGIACILGTGSNSCVWENEKEIINIASDGFIFGDEGSGSYLGIRLVKLYLNGKLSQELRLEFENEFSLTKDQILHKTYKEENPNKFLASFATFFHSRLHHPQLREIIFSGFDDFFTVRVLPYPNYKNYPLGFVGSIAFYYQKILVEIADKYGMSISKITKAPIDELVDFHS
ncbi:MAG: BadF/BadG/BcrA/BcrD ATPase family protein [Flavobacteriales bacterium]